jgi:hypothetical protein
VSKKCTYEISDPRLGYLGLKIGSYESCPIAKLARHFHGTYEIIGSSFAVLVSPLSKTILTEDIKLK